jgi:gliding motility-associated-like protein
MIKLINNIKTDLIIKGLFTLCITQLNIVSAQVLQNYGSVISAKSGSVITVNGSVLNQTGTIDVNQNAGAPATMYVSQDVTNNSTILADGHIHLSGNWFDNGSFQSTLGTVFMDGATQFLGGSSATIFYNLTLNGSGFKIQQVNKFATGVLSLNHLELKTETFAFYMENTATNAITRTTGFVSSLNGGFLGRRTNSNGLYLYPVGSSVGVLRYRPVELTPTNSTPNQYTVRFANLDATLEGYDRSLHDDSLCQSNPLFYHQINQASGTTNADVAISYDPVTDGSWSALSRWNLTSPLWEKITGSFTSSGAPYFKGQKTNWGTFTDIPYILANQVSEPIFDPILPVCHGSQIAPLPTTSNNGISGSWLPVLNNTQTTTYTFTPNAGQCGGTATLTVTVLPQIVQPQVQVIQPLCNQTTGIIEVFTLLSSSTETYSITGTIPVVATQTNGTGSFVNMLPGTYEITITDNGCVSSPSTVVVNTSPTPSIMVNNPSICYGDQANLISTVNPIGGTFSWTNNGETTPDISVSPQETSIYEVTYTLNGCSVQTSSLVTVKPIPTVMVLDQNICLGETINIIALPSSSGGSYEWLPNGETTQSISVTPGVTSTYSVVYTLNQCASLPVSTTVTVNSTPVAGFIANPDAFNDYGESVSFLNTTTNADSYSWDFGDGFISDLYEPTHYFQNIGEDGMEVVLTAYNNEGCSDTFSLIIERKDELIYYVPNAFTPDGNENNEVFKPVFTEGFDPFKFRMLIFNRWGEIVFETHDATIGWDGTYGTGPDIFKCQDGIYTWQIEFRKIDNDEMIYLNGHVTLIK